MKIGLLYTLIKEEEKLIIKELKIRNISVVKINDRSNIIKFDDTTIQNFKKLDCVLIRSLSLKNSLVWARYFESIGVKTFNSYDCLKTCGDKYLTSLKLIKNKIPTPKIGVALDEDSALDLINEIGLPCVIKPVIGSWGRLIAKINDMESAKAILEHKKSLGNMHHQIYYIQEYIKKPGRDIRTIVIGDKVVGGIYRVSKCWKTNTSLGAQIAVCKLNQKIVELSINATNAVKGDMVSIDLFESDNGLLVNEVNGVTEFKKSLKSYKVNIPEEIAKYVVK